MAKTKDWKEEFEFVQDCRSGLGKIVEISNWLLECIIMKFGRDFSNCEPFEEKSTKEVVLIENTATKPVNFEKKELTMKNIRLRSDGRWEGRRCINGQRISVYASSQKECRQKLNTYQKNALKTHKFSLYEYSKKWFALYKQPEVRESTANMYKNIIYNHLQTLTRPLTSYTTDDLQIFINSLGQTRIKEISLLTLRQIYQKALETGLVNKNPALYLQKGKVEKHIVVSYTLSEQKKILNHLKNDNFSWHILGFLLTGARLNELKTIKKNNIRNGWLLIQGSKTSNARRWIKISPRFEKMLLNKQEPLFSYADKVLQKKFRAFRKEIGIEGTIHKLRHTFNTNLYYLGATDMERKSFMGHSSIVVTNDIYTHLDRSISKKDILKLYKDLLPNFDPKIDPKK